MQILISVIVPCYNVSEYLKDFLESIKAQTFKDFEIIFVDDGSTDKTAQIINDFCSSFKTGKLFKQTNSGQGAARNLGLANAKGEYIYMCDPDDYLHPQTLELLYKVIKDNRADVSIGKFKRIFSKHFKDTKIKTFKNINTKMFIGKDENAAQLLSSNKFRYELWDKLLRHDILKTFPSYPNVFIKSCRFLEDVPFLTEYFMRCNLVITFNKPIYFYRIRLTSDTHGVFNIKMLSALDAHKFYSNISEVDYPETQIYTKIKICIDNFELLFRMRKSNLVDKKLVKELYKNYSNNLKYCIHGKRCQWYRKYLMWLSKPFAYLIAHKLLNN